MLGTHVVPYLGSVKLAKLTGLELSSLYGQLLVAGWPAPSGRRHPR